MGSSVGTRQSLAIRIKRPQNCLGRFAANVTYNSPYTSDEDVWGRSAPRTAMMVYFRNMDVTPEYSSGDVRPSLVASENDPPNPKGIDGAEYRAKSISSRLGRIARIVAGPRLLEHLLNDMLHHSSESVLQLLNVSDDGISHSDKYGVKDAKTIINFWLTYTHQTDIRDRLAVQGSTAVSRGPLRHLNFNPRTFRGGLGEHHVIGDGDDMPAVGMNFSSVPPSLTTAPIVSVYTMSSVF